MAGGQKLDDFVDKHFSKTGERNPRTNRWKMKCKYCMADTTVEHREMRCTEHLSKPELCPNAPEPVRKEALIRLATKRNTLSSIPIDELGTPVNPHVVGDDSDDGVAHKKGKTVNGSTTKRQRGVLDAFVDRGLSEEERAEVDLILVRYVRSADIRHRRCNDLHR